jgi:hypothetical protein
MAESTPPSDGPHRAARATIIAAVIGAVAALGVAFLGYQQNAKNGQPTNIVNIFITGVQVIAHKVTGGGGSEVGQRIRRKLPLNETTVFDVDASVAVNAYRPPAEVYLSVNGRPSGWRKPGARLVAKKDAVNICYVEVIAVEEASPSGGNPSFLIDYFCKALK